MSPAPPRERADHVGVDDAVPRRHALELVALDHDVAEVAGVDPDDADVVEVVAADLDAADLGLVRRRGEVDAAEDRRRDVVVLEHDVVDAVLDQHAAADRAAGDLDVVRAVIERDAAGRRGRASKPDRRGVLERDRRELRRSHRPPERTRPARRAALVPRSVSIGYEPPRTWTIAPSGATASGARHGAQRRARKPIASARTGRRCRRRPSSPGRPRCSAADAVAEPLEIATATVGDTPHRALGGALPSSAPYGLPANSDDEAAKAAPDRRERCPPS